MFDIHSHSGLSSKHLYIFCFLYLQLTAGLELPSFCGLYWCLSIEYEFKTCKFPDVIRIRNATVSFRHSVSSCRYYAKSPNDYNGTEGVYGYSDNIFWVDHGCRASFEICYIVTSPLRRTTAPMSASTAIAPSRIYPISTPSLTATMYPEKSLSSSYITFSNKQTTTYAPSNGLSPSNNVSLSSALSRTANIITTTSNPISFMYNKNVNTSSSSITSSSLMSFSSPPPTTSNHFTRATLDISSGTFEKSSKIVNFTQSSVATSIRDNTENTSPTPATDATLLRLKTEASSGTVSSDHETSSSWSKISTSVTVALTISSSKQSWTSTRALSEYHTQNNNKIDDSNDSSSITIFVIGLVLLLLAILVSLGIILWQRRIRRSYSPERQSLQSSDYYVEFV